jgi:type IV pilus assembly protein PilB
VNIGMPKKKELLEILVEQGVISKSDAEAIAKEAKSRGRKVAAILYERGIDERAIAQAQGFLWDLPVKFFEKDEEVPREVMLLIPEDSARHYGLLAFKKEGDVLHVGMVLPDDVRAQEALKFIAQKLGLSIALSVITPSDLARYHRNYRTFADEIRMALEALQRQYPIKEGAGQARAVISLEKASEAVREEAPIIKMVALLLKQAVHERASDIHIEPEKNKLKVRYRIDGELRVALYLPIEIHAAIISRIKIMSDLKIDETRVPQDGRFRTLIEDREIDFRVATFPTSAGEKVAIRVLDPATGLKGLEELGFAPYNEKILLEGLEKPFGMILATGPTGSGKTTTLYALLQLLNKEDVNIVTLEDPIEYYMPGINQSMVMPEIGYTFASGLRQILRQDPDIIMVGEIRDNETAELATHAALTGHIVFSTLHTNNAVGVVPRLVDLGVQPFLLPSTLNLMMAQRLVRQLCPDCKKAKTAQGEEERIIEEAISTMPASLRDELPYRKPYTIYEPVGCDTCKHKGTLGRTGVHEILRMTPELEKIILTKISESDLAQEAKRQGMLSMRHEGILKVLEGKVALQEVLQETTI